MPALDMPEAHLFPRQRSNCSYVDRYGRCYTTWDRWARWTVLGIIILGALFIFFLFSCLSARRRRKRGFAPYRGTAWAAGRTPAGHAPAQYNSAAPHYANQQQQHQGWNNPAPPAYGESQGYYGGQRGNDVELQQPQQAYHGGFAPPPGPPPGKPQNDGIIR